MDTLNFAKPKTLNPKAQKGVSGCGWKWLPALVSGSAEVHESVRCKPSSSKLLPAPKKNKYETQLDRRERREQMGWDHESVRIKAA